MSKSTISTFQLFEMFPDAEAARVYMDGKRWPDGAAIKRGAAVEFSHRIVGSERERGAIYDVFFLTIQD